MEYDIEYFIKTALEAGKYNPSLTNPCSNLAITYGESILKTARKEGYAQVEHLKIDVDDLDDFQYFFIDGEEVSTSQWLEALLELLTEKFDKAYNASS